MDVGASGQENFTKGEGLGPVSARLVAEVILGLLELPAPLESLDRMNLWRGLGHLAREL